MRPSREPSLINGSVENGRRRNLTFTEARRDLMHAKYTGCIMRFLKLVFVPGTGVSSDISQILNVTVTRTQTTPPPFKTLTVTTLFIHRRSLAYPPTQTLIKCLLILRL